MLKQQDKKDINEIKTSSTDKTLHEFVLYTTFSKKKKHNGYIFANGNNLNRELHEFNYHLKVFEKIADLMSISTSACIKSMSSRRSYV